jgi:predicted metal-dependent peptidase
MTQLTPERMISKALIKLATNDPFFGCVAMRMNIESVDKNFVEQFKQARGFDFAMATDGKSIKYNPDWVEKQQLNDLVGVLAHEAAHVALKHQLRRGVRDIKKWNIACDMAINPHLLESGYSLPDYDDAKKAQVAQYIDMSSEKIYGMIPDSPDKQSPPSDSPNSPEEPTSGDSSGQNPNQNQDKFQQAPPDSGGVIDHPQIDKKNPNTQKELEEEADGDIEAAYQASKNTGNVPGWLDRIIRGRRKVLNDYREMLRDWMEKSLYKGDYSWSIPNRRYMASGFCMPGFAPENDAPNFIFAMDTSGSIGTEEEEEFGSHINSVLEEFPSSYTVLFCDTMVRGRQTISHEDLPIELKTQGGGGTNFEDTMKIIRDEYVQSDTPPQGVIFFTDLETCSFGEDPGIPVLWLVHSNHSEDLTVPFGKIVICKSKKEIEAERVE